MKVFAVNQSAVSRFPASEDLSANAHGPAAQLPRAPSRDDLLRELMGEVPHWQAGFAGANAGATQTRSGRERTADVSKPEPEPAPAERTGRARRSPAPQTPPPPGAPVQVQYNGHTITLRPASRCTSGHSNHGSAGERVQHAVSAGNQRRSANAAGRVPGIIVLGLGAASRASGRERRFDAAVGRGQCERPIEIRRPGTRRGHDGDRARPSTVHALFPAGGTARSHQALGPRKPGREKRVQCRRTHRRPAAKLRLAVHGSNLGR